MQNIHAYTVPAKSLGRYGKLNICLPEIDTPLKQSFPEKGLYIAIWDGISLLLDKNFSFGSYLSKSKSIELSKPVKWKRTCQEKPQKR
jgi:hypothetical protein